MYGIRTKEIRNLSTSCTYLQLPSTNPAAEETKAIKILVSTPSQTTRGWACKIHPPYAVFCTRLNNPGLSGKWESCYPASPSTCRRRVASQGTPSGPAELWPNRPRLARGNFWRYIKLNYAGWAAVVGGSLKPVASYLPFCRRNLLWQWSATGGWFDG